MWEIFLDGDNIPVDHYLDEVKSKLTHVLHPCDVNSIVPTVFSQSNMVLKYTSQRMTQMKICCCKTTNKNATDAQILFHTGKAVANGYKVVIVSNDKIFKEIENSEQIFVIGNLNDNSTTKKVRLRKKTVVQAVNEIKNGDDSVDVYLEDIIRYFPNHSLNKVRDFIQSLHDVKINASECVYIL